MTSLITPPSELVREWHASLDCPDGANAKANYFCTLAAQWGADQELEACCEWTAIVGGAEALRAARRPKPPSLKEQAIAQLREVNAMLQFQTTGGETSAIRAALEAFDD
jgi:hypothetical protein